jgi:hypothetical protein
MAMKIKELTVPSVAVAIGFLVTAVLPFRLLNHLIAPRAVGRPRCALIVAADCGLIRGC